MAIHFHDIVGFIGIAMVVGTYLLLQTGRMRSDELRYPLLNGIGAACVLYSIFFAFNLSAFLVEAFWALISSIGVIRYFIRQRSGPSEKQPAEAVPMESAVKEH
ncbi:MAG: CBU_0592 family membrane protein [Rubripirellula sp.]